MVGIYDIHTMTKKVKRRIAEHIGVMRYDDSAFKVFEQVRIVVFFLMVCMPKQDRSKFHISCMA